VQGFDVLRGPAFWLWSTSICGFAWTRPAWLCGYNGVVVFFVISGFYYHVVHQEMGTSGAHPPQAAAPDIQGPIR
jgi:peptidoglycan/LPS O-acetylase OafA/YrhL